MTAVLMRGAHGHITDGIDPPDLWAALRALGLTVGDVPDTKPSGDAAYLKRLGEVIVEIRVIRGISQARLAAEVNKSEAALSRWENGKAAPEATDMRRIRAALGMPSRWFFEPPETTVTPGLLDVAETVEEGLLDGLLEAGGRSRLRPSSRRLRPQRRPPSDGGRPG